jgi:anthranilate synthase/aminodeoxychorismate synthase-like glutamine amidotransferase
VILVLDNYDSFTFNLVQYLGELGAKVEVRRNDVLSVDEVRALAPSGIVVSPGPKTPAEAGICRDVIADVSGDIPILGVCLGHQCIGSVFGGEVVRAERLMHGKTSNVIHTGQGIFAGIDNPFVATRYHSLIVRRDTIDEAVLEIVAWTSEGEVMGLKHRDHETWGVQFHPESILTIQGKPLLQNFLFRCQG